MSMRRRDLLTGATALGFSAGAANAFGIGELGAGMGHLGRLSGAGIPSWAAPGSLFGLDFANSRYWPSPLASQTSFSRASVGEADNISGVWSQFLSGVARITNKGLRYEPGRTNLVTSSAAPSGTNGWTAESGTTTLQSGGGPGPGLDAYLWDDGTTAAATHRLIEPTTQSITSGLIYTASKFVKYINAQFVQLAFPTAAFGVTAYANFDVLNGVVGTVGATATAKVTAYQNGWDKIEITATASAAASSQDNFCCVAPASNSARSVVYNGNHNQFLIWNSQNEAGPSSTSPIITGATATSRLADVLALIRTDIGRIVFTFSDGTTQTISGITKGSPYTVPTTINEQVIARMDGYAS